MTNSTEKVSLFQICSEFLFPSVRRSNSVLSVAKQHTNIQLKERKIFVGKISKKEVDIFLSNWQILITHPEGFPQDASTPISKFLPPKISVSLIDEMVETVISAHHNLACNQEELAEAMKKSNKIFHEDYPGSYILMCNRKRLGMFMFSVCNNDNSTYRVSYQFNSKITSFKDLY